LGKKHLATLTSSIDKAARAAILFSHQNRPLAKLLRQLVPALLQPPGDQRDASNDEQAEKKIRIVCKDLFARICLQGFICKDLFARICLQGCVCKDVFARMCLQGFVCKDSFAKIRLQGFVCKDVFARICLQGFI
jgi:hypothetical protein